MSGTPGDQDRRATVLAPGSRIGGDYEVDALIKAGGMGEVYSAHNIHLLTPAAIKVILPGLEADTLVRDAFLKEARTLQSLQHEAIVRYFAFTRDAHLGRYCLIMEFVEGRPLADFTHGQEMGLGAVLALVRRVCRGLSAAHRAGVVHRDLSPDNVILPEGAVNRAKIIDFGIAKTTTAGTGTLFQDKMVGKFGYMAPEQLGEFDARIGPHTDIYSLGLVIAAVSRGKPLPMGGNYAEAFRARQAVPSLDGVPEPLVPLLDWMLQPNPLDRPASMAQVVEEIDRLAETHADEIDMPEEDDATVVRDLPRDTTPRPVTMRTRSPGKTKKTALRKRGAGAGWFLPALGAAVVLGAGVGVLTLMPGLNPFARPPVEPAGPEIPAAAVPVPPVVTPTIPPAAVPAPPAANIHAAVPEAPKPAETPRTAPPAYGTAPAAPGQAPAAVPPKPVPPMQLDKVSTMLRWLNAYDTGPCSYVAIDNVQDDKVTLLAYGQDPAPFAKLVADFKTSQGVEPDVTFQTITAAQCGVLDYVNWQNNEGAPTTDLELADDTVASGTQVKGRLTGLGGRSVLLTLVGPDGNLANLERFVTRDGSDAATFGVGLRLANGAQPAPYLIFALITDKPLADAQGLQEGAPAAQVLPLIRRKILFEGLKGSSVVRYFRLQ